MRFRTMNLTTINATKIARQIQLCGTYNFGCCKTNTRRIPATFHTKTASSSVITCNSLTSNSSLRSISSSTAVTFYQNNILRKRIASSCSCAPIVLSRSFVTFYCHSVTDKSRNELLSSSSILLSSSQLFANVRRFTGKNKKFSTEESRGAFSQKMDKTNEFQRLPSGVIPKHYNLELKPDLVGFTFSGTVSINVQVNNEFWLKMSKNCYKCVSVRMTMLGKKTGF